jgi:pimeloyl-ACP methyl ester carboxylesterase
MVERVLSRSLNTDATGNFREFDDDRSLPIRIWHIVEACFHMIAHLMKMAWRALTLSYNDPIYPAPFGGFDLARLPWNDAPSSEGLYLFIHGLGGRPHDWINYLEALDPQFHRLAPFIPHAGRCPLQDAAAPLIPILEDYLEKFPGKPVYLVGTSNGGRIAAFLETALSPEKLEGHALSVISIAGVHGGTVMMDFLKQIGAAFIFSPDIADNLSFNSPHSQELLHRWQEKQNEWALKGIKVEHHFYATTEDEQVRPISSSLPHIPDAQYHLIHGHAHMTIVDGVCREVLSL